MVDNAEIPAGVSRAMVMTLFSAGFLLTNNIRMAETMVLKCSRTDLFDGHASYLIALRGTPFGPGDIEMISELGKREGAYPVLVGETQENTDLRCFTEAQFLARLGGAVSSLRPFRPEFAEELRLLGFNSLPNGLTGVPNDLYEQYVRDALQFVFGTAVIRYGQERRGESVPDGIVPLRSGGYFIYDTKAAGDGYEVTAETIRQFAFYVDDFGKRYSATYGQPIAFLVLSSDFTDSAEQKSARSRDLLALTRTPLAYMDSGVLAETVARLASQPRLREGINWNRLLSTPHVTQQLVTEAIGQVRKDRVMEG